MGRLCSCGVARQRAHTCSGCPRRFGGISFLGFKRLTMVPIQTKMIDMSLMKDVDVQWLDAYHQEVSAGRNGQLSRLAESCSTACLTLYAMLILHLSGAGVGGSITPPC